MSFIKALESYDFNQLVMIPKSDLHNHFPLGADRMFIEKWYGNRVAALPNKLADVIEMSKYTSPYITPILSTTKGFEYLVKAALQTADQDGVVLLEMSFDCSFITKYHCNPELFINALHGIHLKVAPTVDFRPELGLNRSISVEKIKSWAFPLIESGYFKSLDLYGIESEKEPDVFRDVYIKAKKLGLKLKAHIGEFSGAEKIKNTCEILNLDEVQHGISAAQSNSVMKFLCKNNIRLNICPTSNIILGRVNSYRDHPIRKLFDSGVRVTINSDDIFVFNQSVSQEYLNLYSNNVFSPEELDFIRLEGLKTD